MHKEVNDFIKEVKAIFPDMFNDKKVFDAGSRNINGSARKHFKNCDYVGVDLFDGDGVDIVSTISSHLLGRHKYDVIICVEAMEHNFFWDVDWLLFKKSLNPGGLVIMTCAGPNRKEHGTHERQPDDSPGTLDFYRNMEIDDLPIPDYAEWSIAEYRRNSFDLVVAYKI